MEANDGIGVYAGKEKPLHSGHRQRMLKRFEADAEHFHDHEILEVLLFNAIPRNNTNPIAHALINSFGSLAGVFQASINELMLVRGVGKRTAEYIRCIGLCYERVKPVSASLPQYFNPKAFFDYLEEDYRGKVKEELELFCLDKQDRMYFRKKFSLGKSDTVEIDPREISELLLIQKPHSVVAAHNHPQSRRFPSKADDSFTKRLHMLCFMSNVTLADHIIVGTDGSYSYRAAGKLDKIRASCKDIESDTDGGI